MDDARTVNLTGTVALGIATDIGAAVEAATLDPHGVAQVRFAADGHRTLVFGGGEDLCRTLA